MSSYPLAQQYNDDDEDKLVPLGAARPQPPAAPPRPAPPGPGQAPPDPEYDDEDGYEAYDEQADASGLVDERPPAPPRPILRDEHYRHQMVAGKEVRDTWWRRSTKRVRDLTISSAAREEQALDARLRTLPTVTRQNIIAFISPRGGVGKTTLSFTIGAAWAEFTRASVLCVDGDSDYGPLANLATDGSRSDRGLDDVLRDFDQRPSLAELRPYLSGTPTGLRLLGAPTDPQVMERLEPADYDRLLELLADAEMVLIDCGAGLTKPLAKWAIRRADQLVVITKPDWMTANNVAQALSGVPRERATLVLNQLRADAPGDRRALEAHFTRHELRQRVTVPFDEQLAAMLDSATYDLNRLTRTTRLSLKTLAATVGEGFV